MIPPPPAPGKLIPFGAGRSREGHLEEIPPCSSSGASRTEETFARVQSSRVPGGVPGALERAEKETADTDRKGFRRLEGQPQVGFTRWAFLGTLWGETGHVESHLEKPPRSKHSQNSNSRNSETVKAQTQTDGSQAGVILPPGDTRLGVVLAYNP